MAHTEGSWEEWRIHIVEELRRNTAAIETLQAEMASVKSAAKMWSSITSLVVTPIVAGIIGLLFVAFTN